MREVTPVIACDARAAPGTGQSHSRIPDPVVLRRYSMISDTDVPTVQLNRLHVSAKAGAMIGLLAEVCAGSMFSSRVPANHRRCP
jgi:hypothetical protein